MLILRPEPGAGITQARAERMGYEAVSIPLFAVAPVDWIPPDPADFDALMLTSANALRNAGGGLELYRALPVFAVGGATGKIAREAGFTVAVEGSEGAEALERLLEEAGHRRILHLCGLHLSVGGDGRISRVPVYESATLDRPEGFSEALERKPVALLHSPRAAARLAELASNRADIMLAAISPAAAHAAGPGWKNIATAATPDDQALLEIAARLCDHNGP